MFQTHQLDWFHGGFLLCAGVVIALMALAHFGRLKLQNYLVFMLIGLAFLLIIAVNGLRISDDDQLRSEICELNPLTVSNLVISEGNIRRQIIETNEIILLFDQLQQVKRVPAHHSSPTDPVEIGFRSHGLVYRYKVSRDSERPDEYWVLETERAGEPGREIGRIQSAQLKPVFGRLLSDQP